MKMVYTNQNQLLVSNVKNLIEAENINTFLKNEYAQGAIGEISAIDSWPEVWVVDDSDYKRATEIVSLSQRNQNTAAWTCKNCAEQNDASFEICWYCQSDKG